MKRFDHNRLPHQGALLPAPRPEGHGRLIRQRLCTPWLLATLLTVTVACSSDDDSNVMSAPDDMPASAPPDTTDALEPITWSACESGSGSMGLDLECATLVVPRDYAEPEGASLSLALARHTAASDSRRGVLLINPGGPGGSGVQALREVIDAGTVPDIVLDEFDIVAFDPRGVGASTPLACDEFAFDDLDPYPLTDEDLAAQFTAIEQQNAACQEKEGNYLTQLGSNDVVRDMESIRLALDEEQINFLGYSYGTRLAAMYLQAYPQNSGRFVLDASVSPRQDALSFDPAPLRQAQANFESMLALCPRVDASCEPAAFGQRLTQRIETLREQQLIDEFELLGGLLFLVSEEPAIAELAVAPLYEYTIDFDADVLVQFEEFVASLFGDEEGENEVESDDELDESDGVSAERAVICSDQMLRPTLDSTIELLMNFNTVSDLFAEAYIQLPAMCAGWPETLQPVLDIATNQAPQALVIGGSSDASTPMVWSEEMADAIGGVFLRSEHSGHTVVFQGESQCVDEVIVAFLSRGELPSQSECR